MSRNLSWINLNNLTCGIVDCYINEFRITKSHKQGYLDPFDYETCESCLLNKITKSPFIEKEKDLACC